MKTSPHTSHTDPSSGHPTHYLHTPLQCIEITFLRPSHWYSTWSNITLRQASIDALTLRLGRTHSNTFIRPTQHSFIKNIKECKERSVLLIKNTKEHENVVFFWKERENVVFFWKERMPNPAIDQRYKHQLHMYLGNCISIENPKIQTFSLFLFCFTVDLQPNRA